MSIENKLIGYSTLGVIILMFLSFVIGVFNWKVLVAIFVLVVFQGINIFSMQYIAKVEKDNSYKNLEKKAETSYCRKKINEKLQEIYGRGISWEAGIGMMSGFKLYSVQGRQRLFFAVTGRFDELYTWINIVYDVEEEKIMRDIQDFDEELYNNPFHTFEPEKNMTGGMGMLGTPFYGKNKYTGKYGMQSLVNNQIQQQMQQQYQQPDYQQEKDEKLKREAEEIRQKLKR
jgi:hypothetical protein